MLYFFRNVRIVSKAIDEAIAKLNNDAANVGIMPNSLDRVACWLNVFNCLTDMVGIVFFCPVLAEMCARSIKWERIQKETFRLLAR